MVGVYKCLSLIAGVAVTVACGRLSLVAISFYALSLLFGPCRLSVFTVAGSHTPLRTATAAKTSLLKWNKRVFKLCRVYSNLLKMSNIGKFSWPVDAQVQKEKENFAVACLRPL